MPDGFAYTSLALKAIRSEEQGAYLFGVELDGAFIVIASRKLGGVDDQIAAAKAIAAEQAASSTTSSGTTSSSGASSTDVQTASSGAGGSTDQAPAGEPPTSQ